MPDIHGSGMYEMTMDELSTMLVTKSLTSSVMIPDPEVKLAPMAAFGLHVTMLDGSCHQLIMSNDTMIEVLTDMLLAVGLGSSEMVVSLLKVLLTVRETGKEDEDGTFD